MKLSNFRNPIIVGEITLATIDITSGIPLINRTKRAVQIRKEHGRWCFINAGTYTPGTIVDELEHAYYA